jgi:hypothetical protein
MLHRRRRALAAAATVAALAAGTAGALLPTVANAAPPASTTPDNTYQVNGKVEAVVYIGTTVVLGGEFTGVARHGSSTYDTNYHYLAAFDANSGALIPSFKPNPDKPVRALATDGTAIYAGGEFSTFGTDSRPKLARLSTSGTLDTTFAPPAPNALVSALAVAGGYVYLGGAFTTLAGGTVVDRVARVTDTDGAVDLTWRPTIANTTRTDAPSVRALTVSGASVYIGGYFQAVQGQPRRSAALVSTDSKAPLQSWNPRLVVKQSKNRGIVYAIQTYGSIAFVCGDFAYANGDVGTETGGTASPNLAAVDTTDGRLVTDRFWETTDGSVNDCLVAGNTLYVTGHFDYAGGRMGYYPGYTCTGPTPETCKIPYTGPRAANGIDPLPLNKIAAFDLTASNAQGHLVQSWVPQMASIHGGYGLAVSPGSPQRLAVGGDFTKIGRLTPGSNGKTYPQNDFAQFG